MGFCQKVEELSMILSTLTFERRWKIIRLRCDLVPFECRLDLQIGAFLLTSRTWRVIYLLKVHWELRLVIDYNSLSATRRKT